MKDITVHRSLIGIVCLLTASAAMTAPPDPKAVYRAASAAITLGDCTSGVPLLLKYKDMMGSRLDAAPEIKDSIDKQIIACTMGGDVISGIFSEREHSSVKIHGKSQPALKLQGHVKTEAMGNIMAKSGKLETPSVVVETTRMTATPAGPN